MTLLGPNETPPFRIINGAGQSSFLLLGDHAGNEVPVRLARLGLNDAELTRHIGQDIGVSALGARLAQWLDACFIEQRYSRLVVDCNRHAKAADAMPAISDSTAVPANRDISPAERAARLAEIYDSYHRAIAETLAARRQAARPTVLVALHSFTPRLTGGAARPWDIGVLYGGGETAFARAVLGALQAQPGLCVGDNEPYRMDETDYTVPHHAFPAGMDYVEIEVNQARLGGDAGIAEMAEVLVEVLAVHGEGQG